MDSSVAGGGAAIAVSGALLLAVLRGVGLNPLNAWTIFLGVLAGVAAIAGRHRRWLCRFGLACLVLAAAPALVGGVGLLYLPAVVLVGVAARRDDIPAGRTADPAGHSNQWSR